jgi:hypothetical protein
MIITNEEKAEIIKVVMKNGKGFRASKPKVDYNKPITGRIVYVWRMVGFQISKNRSHHCMPVCAEFGLAESDWKNRREVCKVLDELVKEIVDEIPVGERHGINRWAKALGY